MWLLDDETRTTKSALIKLLFEDYETRSSGFTSSQEMWIATRLAVRGGGMCDFGEVMCALTEMMVSLMVDNGRDHGLAVVDQGSLCDVDGAVVP